MIIIIAKYLDVSEANPAPPLEENDRLAQLLTNVFKHTNFRSREQLDATKALIDGDRDVMVFMSTGKLIVSISKASIYFSRERQISYLPTCHTDEKSDFHCCGAYTELSQRPSHKIE